MSSLIKVLIVDDSALMRQMLTSILESDPAFDVVGSAPHPLKARELIKKLNPDVLTLDIEMPEMNGIDFLKKIMSLRPMPVVMISSLTQSGAEMTLQALEIGAVDFVSKPQLDFKNGMAMKAQEIIDKVKMAALAKVKAFETPKIIPIKPVPVESRSVKKKMIVIGSSTGGVEALRTVLAPLPANMPPIFVVQHMPKQFTVTFSCRLNTLTDLYVKEAEHNDIAQQGCVYIAPGDRHLQVVEEKGQLVCKLSDGEAVTGHIPSANVLFDSVNEISPKDTIGVILSGMGKDGAEGLVSMKKNGAYNIGQNEQSCVVYGMPRVAKEMGGINLECDLKKIPSALVNVCFETK